MTIWRKRLPLAVAIIAEACAAITVSSSSDGFATGVFVALMCAALIGTTWLLTLVEQ